MEQPAIIEARDTNTIMLPFVTNFNNAHPATIIIASPAIAAAITAQEGRNQQLIATGVSVLFALFCFRSVQTPNWTSD